MLLPKVASFAGFWAAARNAPCYSEPPDWVVPLRHALGAFLLKDGRANEAEAVHLAVHGDDHAAHALQDGVELLSQ